MINNIPETGCRVQAYPRYNVSPGNVKKLFPPTSKPCRLLFCFLLLLSGGMRAQSAYSGLENWFHTETLSMAGAGGTLSSVESDRLNPAALGELPRQFHLSFLRYPADINAESLSLILPAGRGFYALGLRHLNYGLFEGFDADGQSTDNYTAGDTWVTLSAGETLKSRKISWGITAGLFLSRLENYQSTALVFTPGILFDIKSVNGKLGISLQNLGKVIDRYTRVRERLPTTVVTSVSKRLEHLPLELFVDGGYRLTTETFWLRLGGIFRLPYNFQLKWGTNTDKFSQQTRTNIGKDFIGSSGVGLSYRFEEYHFDLGSYFYGTGGWISSIGFGVTF
ncbi:MAG: hypothetical protein GXO92_04710 [FCB group bacterium]|nr:hypothetical protein [FCB group bacterium]